MKRANLKKVKHAMLSFLIIILVLSFTILLLSGCKDTESKQLDVYMWEGYLPEEVAALFEQETGVELNVNFVAENAIMLTLIQGGGKADIVNPTQSHVSRYYEAGLAQPIDIKKINNYENVSKSLRDQPWTKWDGQQTGNGETYAIPYIFGTSGLSINTSKYTGRIDNIGWEILFNKDLNGRVSSKNAFETLWIILAMYDIPRENFITDPQNTSEQIIDKAIELKNNVLKFYNSESEAIDLMKNEEVWVSFVYDGAARRLSQYDSKFKYVLPKNGGFGWTDTFIIPNTAKNPEEANLFIDFMLRPDIAAIVTEQGGFNTTVEGALDLIEGIDKDLYRLTDEQMEKLLWTPNLNEEQRSFLVSFWEEILTMQ
jgi:spermidine/putrescine transport system substrate-binding protein